MYHAIYVTEIVDFIDECLKYKYINRHERERNRRRML